MRKYLLDTDICIYLLKGKFSLQQKINSVGTKHCFISEITVAELGYGIEKSKTPETLREPVTQLISRFSVLPIYPALYKFGTEKARLERQGMVIGDFDILIGCTAMANDMIMVTNNVQHFSRLEPLTIENWTL